MGELTAKLPNTYRCATCGYVAARAAFRFDLIGISRFVIKTPEYVFRQLRQELASDEDFRLMCERQFVTTDTETIVRRLFEFVFEHNTPCKTFRGFCPSCRSRCYQKVIGEIGLTARLH